MKHLHFTQSLEPLNGGGLGSSTVALHREMLECGMPSVLCSTHGGTPQRPSPGAAEFRRIKPDVIYYSPAMQRAAPDMVREADIIHGHGLYTGTNFIFGREARRQCKPLVYHAHGFFEPWILKRSRWKKRLVHWLFEDANTRHIRLWRALTAKEADQIRDCGYQSPIVVAPNGLDLADYSDSEDASGLIQTPLIPNLAKRRRRALFLARLHPKKGLDLLLPAWASLKQERRDWELVIAGPDEQGHMSKVQELSRALGLDDEVLLTGTVTGSSKLALLHSADLFVLPSYSEGFSMGILEAMACRIPVVATRACNCPAISRVASGWECDATADSLVAALRAALLAGEQERRQRGQNGRRLIEAQYQWSQIVSTLVQACAAHC